MKTRLPKIVPIHHIDIAFSFGDLYGIQSNVSLIHRIHDDGIFIPYNINIKKIYPYVLRHFGRVMGYRPTSHSPAVMKRNIRNANRMQHMFSEPEKRELRCVSAAVRYDGYMTFGTTMQKCKQFDMREVPAPILNVKYEQPMLKDVNLLLALRHLQHLMNMQRRPGAIAPFDWFLDYGMVKLDAEAVMKLKTYSISNFFGGSLIALMKDKRDAFLLITANGDFYMVMDRNRVFSRFMYAYTRGTDVIVGLYSDTDLYNHVYTNVVPTNFILTTIFAHHVDKSEQQKLNAYSVNDIKLETVPMGDADNRYVQSIDTNAPMNRDYYNITTCNNIQVLRLFKWKTTGFIIDVEGNIHDHCTSIGNRRGSSFATFVDYVFVKKYYETNAQQSTTCVTKNSMSCNSALDDETPISDASYDSGSAYGSEDDSEDERRSRPAPIHCIAKYAVLDENNEYDEDELHNNPNYRECVTISNKYIAMGGTSADDAYKHVNNMNQSLLPDTITPMVGTLVVGIAIVGIVIGGVYAEKA